MTTPQHQLYDISYKINHLIKLFECEDDKKSIFEEVTQLCENNENIIKRLDMIQDQMALIIKLLGKEKS